MIIIIEGVDKCGKTTLAEHIVKNYGFEYIKCSQPTPQGPFKDYMEILDGIEQSNNNVVLDRFYIGEDVYGPVYRGRSDLTENQKETIEDRLINLNAIVIYASDNIFDIAKRFDTEKEVFTQKEDIHTLLDSYTKALSAVDFRIPVFNHIMKTDFDYTQNGKLDLIIEATKYQQDIFKRIIADTYYTGDTVAPRGQEVKEIETMKYVLPPYVRFMSFKARKLSIGYIKKEILWYIKGDRLDNSIVEHAKLWGEIQNEDGSINSNYGQYIFGDQKQFDTVVNTLTYDKDSRRASIMILNKDHLQSDTKDVPCTYSMNFRIRNNKLNMTVHMRSQDAIFGMGNDAPTFSIIQEMILETLREVYTELECGTYTHIADSFHIYEKHYGMVEKIINEKQTEFKDIYCPRIHDISEVEYLRNGNYSNIPKEYVFTKWLTS